MKLITAMMALSATAFSTEYIVKLKNNDMKSLFSLSEYGQVRELDVSVGNFAVIKSDKEIAHINHPAVEYIEENIRYELFSNDELFKKQWALNNTGFNSWSVLLPGKKGVDIDALEAWKITKGNKEIKVAVIDTGVDYNHKDLVKNIMVNEAEKNGVEGVDDDGNGYIDDIYGYDFHDEDADPMDDHGHGTHCAGVIGASHDDFGIAGVMDNVKILPVRFLSARGGTLEGAIKSIDYAIKRGVDIMSNSWGGGGFSQALKDVIEEANKAGIVFIAAAGNANNDNDKKASYPATYDVENIISVGALSGRGKRASFSNYGKETVHVFAPGVNILSTVPGNQHKKMSGTSMATPYVSGIVGLMLSINNNMTPAEVKQRAIESTVKSDDLVDYAQSGYISALKAVE